MFKWEYYRLRNYRRIIDLGRLVVIILINVGSENLPCYRSIVSWIDSDLKIPKLSSLSEPVPNRIGIGRVKVREPTSSIADNEIGDTSYLKSLVIMGMACEICANSIGMIQIFPWPEVQIDCGTVMVPDRMVLYYKFSQQVTVQDEL